MKHQIYDIGNYFDVFARRLMLCNIRKLDAQTISFCKFKMVNSSDLKQYMYRPQAVCSEEAAMNC